jgi:hypothetical protein
VLLRVARGLRDAARLYTPPAARLTLSRFWPELAARVWREEGTRIEPMGCPSAGENRWQDALKLRILRATMVPQCLYGRAVREAEYFLHPTVAIGGNDQNASRYCRGWLREFEHEIVMELALLRVLKQSVMATHTIDAREERTQAKV